MFCKIVSWMLQSVYIKLDHFTKAIFLKNLNVQVQSTFLFQISMFLMFPRILTFVEILIFVVKKKLQLNTNVILQLFLVKY